MAEAPGGRDDGAARLTGEATSGPASGEAAPGLPPAATSICAQCAVVCGMVCCEVPPGEKLATLTFTDIERIEAATGLPRQRFVETEQLDPAERLFYETSRPIYRGVFVGGLRHGLRAVRGACVFFEKGRGCTLPPDAKPVACQLYPFDYDLAGDLTLVDAPHCLALQRAASWPELMRMFGVSRRSLRRLHRQAAQECADHAAELRRRGDERR